MSALPEISKEWEQQIEEQTSLITMHAFAYHLKEIGDPRWEPIEFLASHGKLGHVVKNTGDSNVTYLGFRRYYDYSLGSVERSQAIDVQWWFALNRFTQEKQSLAKFWMDAAKVWLNADEGTRRVWEINTQVSEKADYSSVVIPKSVTKYAAAELRKIEQALKCCPNEGDIFKLTKAFLKDGTRIKNIEEDYDQMIQAWLHRFWSLYNLHEQVMPNLQDGLEFMQEYDLSDN